MENTIENKRSPIYPQQDYIWYAINNDNSKVYEYDNNKKETMFDYLDKTNVKHFGLLGNGITFSFDRESGQFYISDKPIDLSININNKPISLKGDKDIIQFKMAHTDGSFIKKGPITYRKSIDGFFMGYKMKTTIDNKDLYIQINIGIPMAGEDRRPFLGIKITSPVNDICIITLNKKETELKLEEGKSNFVNIYFQ